MRIRRPVRPSKKNTGAFCATCHVVRGVEQVESHAETTTFTLTCGHTVMLTPGAVCKLDMQADAITIYPNPDDLPVRQGATS